MEQFRKLGEAMGSMRAMMVLQDENFQINRRQCTLLFDIFDLAFTTIAEEVKKTRLKHKEKKWKALERPLKELCKVFRDGDSYIRGCCLEPATEESSSLWWAAHAFLLHENRDCVELHIHNLFSCFAIVIEAIENAAVGEFSGMELEEIQMRRLMVTKKYDKVWNDPKLFRWNYGKQYLVTDKIVHKLDTAWREDRWLLLETINSKIVQSNSKHRHLSWHDKYEQRVGEMLTKKLTGSALLFPSWFLTGALDFQVKRRLGKGSQFREIHWMGDNFVLRRLNTGGESTETLESEVSQVLSLSHPNVVQYLCGFYDEEKKEYMFITEVMTKDLNAHIKDLSGPKRRLPFSLPVVVDIMLQIARGMEYLHSHKIYHGELNPSNILIKLRNSNPSDAYVHAKISGFDFRSLEKSPPTPRAASFSSAEKDESSSALNSIWYAPEVLCEQEKPRRESSFKYSEKADVYSYGMLCFELLTGKLPFEDGHLQGDKVSRNVRVGERPLFPFCPPKCLYSLTKKCWQTDKEQRPSFSTICRILRHIRRSMVINPYLGFPEIPAPHADLFEIDAVLFKTPTDVIRPVWEIPYELFAYKLEERDRLNGDDQKHRNNSNSECDHCEGEVTTIMPATGRNHTDITNTARLSELEHQLQSQSLERKDTRYVCSDMSSNKGVSQPPSLRKAHSMAPERDSCVFGAMMARLNNYNVHTSGPLQQEKKKPTVSRLKRSVSVSTSSPLHSLFSIQDRVSVSSDQIARGSPLSKSSDQVIEVPEKKPASPLRKRSWSAGILNAGKGAKPFQRNQKKGAEKSASLSGRVNRHFFLV